MQTMKPTKDDVKTRLEEAIEVLGSIKEMPIEKMQFTIQNDEMFTCGGENYHKGKLVLVVEYLEAN